MNVGQAPFIDETYAHGPATGKNLPIDPHGVAMNVEADAVELRNFSQTNFVANL
jgi:hypothetical protein